MKFKVDRDTLAQKLAIASQTVGKGPVLKTNPSLAGFLFKVGDDGKATVFTTNTQQFTRVSFEIKDVEKEASDTGLFLVGSEKFLKTINLFESGEVRFTVTNKGVRLTTDEEQVPFTLLDVKDFPQIEDKIAKAEEKGDIDVPAFSRCLDFLKPNISTNENNPIFTFTEYSDGVFKATTGAVLAFYKTSFGVNLKIWGSCIPALLGFIKGAEKIKVSETNNHFIFRNADDVFGFVKVTYNFRAAKVKPDDFNEPEHFTIKREEFLKAMNIIQVNIDPSWDKYVRFAVSGEKEQAALIGRALTSAGAETVSRRIPIVRHKAGADGQELKASFLDLLSTFQSFNGFGTDNVDVYVQPDKWFKLVFKTDNGDVAIAMVG